MGNSITRNIFSTFYPIILFGYYLIAEKCINKPIFQSAIGENLD